MKNILTGITPSGTPHIGNYIGAIKPAIEKSKSNNQNNYFYFLSDYHALVKCQDAKLVEQYSLEIAATWLALGLDTSKAFFYRQSRIEETTQLSWILTCLAPKGLLNRAHAYKALVDENISANKDKDKNITMGLFSYPILMAADILLFDTNLVPVGKDQVQHIEIARDLANYFNKTYEDILVLPEVDLACDDVLSGLDGRKMSKSYKNTIELFASEKELRKKIMKIATNSLAPGEAKDYNTCSLFKIYKEFASENEIEEIKKAYEEGIAWGEMKNILFEKINQTLSGAREKYKYFIENKHEVENILEAGEEKTRKIAKEKLDTIKYALGLRAFH